MRRCLVGAPVAACAIIAILATARADCPVSSASAAVDATIRGLNGGDTGKVGMDTYAVGGYRTHRDPSGRCTDLVLQGSWYENIRADAFGGEGISTSGSSFAARITKDDGHELA